MAAKNLTFVLLNIALLLEALVYGLIAPLVPHYARVLSAASGELGIIFAVYSLALLLASFPAGMACDLWGRRHVLLAGLVMLLTSTLFFAWAQNLWLMIVSRIFQGAAGAAIWTAVLAATASLFPHGERGRRLGLMMAVTGLGTIAGPVFSGLTFKLWGYQAPFLLTALAITPVTLAFVRLPLPETNRDSAAETTGLGGFLQSLGDKDMALVLLLVTAGSFSFGMLEPLLPLHLSRVFQMDSGEIGVFFGCLSLAYSGVEPLWGYLSDRVGYWRMILTGLTGTVVILPVLALVDQLLILYVTGCLYSFVCCAMLVPCLPLLAKYSDARGGNNYGRHFGLVNASYSVGLLLGPAVGGLVAQYFSFLGAALLYSFLLVVLGGFIVHNRWKAGKKPEA